MGCGGDELPEAGGLHPAAQFTRLQALHAVTSLEEVLLHVRRIAGIEGWIADDGNVVALQITRILQGQFQLAPALESLDREDRHIPVECHATRLVQHIQYSLNDG